MKCKILQLLLTKLYNTFYPEKFIYTLFTLPPACDSPIPLCPKHPLLGVFLRQQQVEKIIQNIVC